MNFELQEHYQRIHINGLKLIRNESYFIDKDIFNPEDLRRGITLLASPNEAISFKINKIIKEISNFEPDQYYYPQQDIHITIMSIISCYRGFSLDSIDIKDYIKTIKKSLAEIDNLGIHFRGISLNPSGIFVNGYPKSNSLNDLRSALRTHFKQTNLEQSLDQRYTLKTAHSTILRFQQALNQPKRLIEFSEQHRKTDLGSFEVKNLELVFNDWYQKAENTILLKKFPI